MNIRDEVLRRMAEQDVTKACLAELLMGRVKAPTLYAWLRGEQDITVEKLGHVLDVLKGRIEWEHSETVISEEWWAERRGQGRHCRGCYGRRISAAELEQMRRERDQGHTQQAIAKRHRVSQPTVSRYCG